LLTACFLKIFQLDGDYHEKHLKSTGSNTSEDWNLRISMSL
jgi:hypothetical protein